MARKSKSSKTDEYTSPREASYELGDKETHDWLVELQGDSGNKKSCSIGVVANASEFGTLDQADRLLVNARMQVTLKLLADDGETPALTVQHINEACECHGISIKDHGVISFRLTFERTEELRHQLVKFGYSSARMVFCRTGDAGSGAEDAATVGGDAEDDPHQMRLTDDMRGGVDDPQFDEVTA